MTEDYAAFAALECLETGHVLADEWTLRPAWVGAGVSIELVHFDRVCSRCGAFDRVWQKIAGDRSPLDEPLPLADWLTRHGATVEAPEGTVRYPDAVAIVRTALDGRESDQLP